jgi:hypothetical protein
LNIRICIQIGNVCFCTVGVGFCSSAVDASCRRKTWQGLYLLFPFVMLLPVTLEVHCYFSLTS